MTDWQQSANSLREVSTRRRHRRGRGIRLDRRGLPQLFQNQQRAREDGFVVDEFQREIVATQLSLVPNAIRQPPDRRVIEEQCLGHDLQRIDQPIVPENVSQLVSDDRFQLSRRQSGQHAGREQNDRPQITHHHRHSHQRRFSDPHNARKPHPPRKLQQRLLHRLCHRRQTDSPQSPLSPQTQHRTQRTQHDSHDPQRHQQRQSRLNNRSHFCNQMLHPRSLGLRPEPSVTRINQRHHRSQVLDCGPCAGFHFGILNNVPRRTRSHHRCDIARIPQLNRQHIAHRCDSRNDRQFH